MQIVIEIEKDEYWNIVRDRKFDGRRLYHFERMIADGIPLPTGHGRLIDADAMQKYQIDTFGQRLLVIDTAPTIIEAEVQG